MFATNSVDVNVELAKIKESQVRVTFKDISTDYWNYRRAYFFHQVQYTPK